MMRLLLIIILFLGWLSASAQNMKPVNKGAFEFSYANDVTGMNDQYYTNGVRFSLTLPVFSRSPFNPRWLREGNFSTSYHTVNFQYDVFTPDLQAPLYTDRPFAATMMLGSKHQYVSHAKNLRLASELRLGMIGQAAGAGKLQNGLHELMPGAGPVEGWDTQIRNDLSINYIFSAEKRFIIYDFVEIIAGSSVYIGLPYTKLEPELVFRLGFFDNYFNVLNGLGHRSWQAYFVGGVSGAIVAYNATLQGGLFNQFNPYELDQINHLVGRYFGGVGVSYHNSNLIFTQTYLSPEFPGGTSHSWGELRLIFSF